MSLSEAAVHISGIAQVGLHAGMSLAEAAVHTSGIAQVST